MIGDLERDAVRRSFDTKVIGPLMLARAFRGQINDGGSIVVFSGVAAFDIEPGTLAVAITNGAADTLTRSLAVELAPIRVNAISPGVVDTGAWDALGEERKASLFAERSERNPARRIGTPEDVADAAILAMSNTFMTGVTSTSTEVSGSHDLQDRSPHRAGERRRSRLGLLHREGAAA
jgi:NAD(P)-dependent dehydrogenase (short-subunit alcohol dehydrogenase family)